MLTQCDVYFYFYFVLVANPGLCTFKALAVPLSYLPSPVSCYLHTSNLLSSSSLVISNTLYQCSNTLVCRNNVPRMQIWSCCLPVFYCSVALCSYGIKAELLSLIWNPFFDFSWRVSPYREEHWAMCLNGCVLYFIQKFNLVVLRRLLKFSGPPYCHKWEVVFYISGLISCLFPFTSHTRLL